MLFWPEIISIVDLNKPVLRTLIVVQMSPHTIDFYNIDRSFDRAFESSHIETDVSAA